jgi:hypothetical protein
MLTFSFSTKNLNKEKKSFYSDVEISREDGSELDIQEMLELFKSFLLGMTYHQDNVNRIVYVERCDKKEQRCDTDKACTSIL